MNDKILKLITGFALLLSTATLNAQTIFDVELVFFKRLGELNLKGQQEPIMLESADSEFLLSNTDSLLPEGYTLLQRNQQKLEGVYRRLKTSPTMRPLLHIGWRQELQDKAETPWLNFNVTDAPEQEGLVDFQGLIRLSRNQGLVLESQIVGFKEAPQTDNSLDSETPEETSDSADLNLPFNSASEQEQDIAVNEESTEVSEVNENLQIPDPLSGFFEMSETLKVKLGKLYYIDHPTMGLLVKVTPYQASLEEQDALN